VLKVAAQRRGAIEVHADSTELTALKAELAASGKRNDTVMVGSVLLLGGLVWLALTAGFAWPGWLLVVLGAGAIVFGWVR
jgi:hypothetical protein